MLVAQVTCKFNMLGEEIVGDREYYPTRVTIDGVEMFKAIFGMYRHD